MEEKKVIEVNEYQQRLIIGSLNDKRNRLVELDRPTDFVDEVLMLTMDAPTRKQNKREKKER